MYQKVTLITGAAGEIGQALVKSLVEANSDNLVTLDLQPLPDELQGVSTHIRGDILDKAVLAELSAKYDFDLIFHLAALLSTAGEREPELAHNVNVGGTAGLLHLAAEQSKQRGQPVRFIFPSTIAIYGLPDLETKQRENRVRERDWNYPTTMYGCNKLYCEMLGIYFSQHYRQLTPNWPAKVDFRSVRFPGLISAFTTPTGGTSDYGPEMLHAAAKNEPYACFVREDTSIPFMAMPDAITALVNLAQAPREMLKQTIYNVTSFSLTAAEFRDLTIAAFPSAEITFKSDLRRQGIVDSWPVDTDDSPARRDWAWQPAYDKERAFGEYLVPNISQRYKNQSG